MILAHVEDMLIHKYMYCTCRIMSIQPAINKGIRPKSIGMHTTCMCSIHAIMKIDYFYYMYCTCTL